jgi:hypothetical protein
VRKVTAATLMVVVLAGCGDDSGGGSSDPELVQLLQDEAHQSEAIASCIADKVDANDAIDREELEAIIRGEGSTDTVTASAYADAALQCAEEAAGDLPGVPDDLLDQLSS